MKVLHLPYNISQWASINVLALKKEGIDARAVVFAQKVETHSHDHIIYIRQDNFILRLISYVKFIRHIMWADVIHWYWDEKILPGGLAIKIVKWLKKPALVEWLGSEIRSPQVEFDTNPFFKAEFPELYTDSPESKNKSALELQQRFAKANFATLIMPSMKQYLKEDLFEHNYSIRARLDLETLPAPEDGSKSKISIVHAPSVKKIKGTKYVYEAIEKLKEDGYDFEFTLVHNVKHHDALKIIAGCDIFVDQLLCGSHGLATIEAMALNKMVVVYIKESLLDVYPSDLPIVNANPSSLYGVLKHHLENPELIELAAAKGRPYVEKYHDAKPLTNDLIEIYEDLIQVTKKS